MMDGAENEVEESCLCRVSQELFKSFKSALT